MVAQYLIQRQEEDMEIPMVLHQDGVAIGYFTEQKEILKEMAED